MDGATSLTCEIMNLQAVLRWYVLRLEALSASNFAFNAKLKADAISSALDAVEKEVKAMSADELELYDIYVPQKNNNEAQPLEFSEPFAAFDATPQFYTELKAFSLDSADSVDRTLFASHEELERKIINSKIREALDKPHSDLFQVINIYRLGFMAWTSYEYQSQYPLPIIEILKRFYDGSYELTESNKGIRLNLQENVVVRAVVDEANRLLEIGDETAISKAAHIYSHLSKEAFGSKIVVKDEDVIADINDNSSPLRTSLSTHRSFFNISPPRSLTTVLGVIDAVESKANDAENQPKL